MYLSLHLSLMVKTHFMVHIGVSKQKYFLQICRKIVTRYDTSSAGPREIHCLAVADPGFDLGGVDFVRGCR